MQSLLASAAAAAPTRASAGAAASRAGQLLLPLLLPRRGTVVVSRKHEVDRPYPELDRRPLHELEDYPDRVPIHSKLYETAEVLSFKPDPEQQLLRVRLSRDVAGLGESGQTVSVHRSRYWHYLYPLGWASIVTSGGGGHGEDTVGTDWRSARVFTGPLFRLQRTLEAMHLLVPINRDAAGLADCQLSERHICVALRRYGVEIPRRAIRLPERPPALGALSSARRQQQQQRTFKVGVQLNSQVTVSVKASLHPIVLGQAGTGLPPAQLPPVEVDNWLSEMHPQPVLPKYAKVLEDYMMRQGPPDFEQILGSNRSRVYKKR